jgi:uncharacterized SAM-binding protein YcdF (DUF218 family)
MSETAYPKWPVFRRSVVAAFQRSLTTGQLLADGYAPLVVFAGRGNARLSEAEIYADAATWLGVSPDVIRLDPMPASTAEHPASLLKVRDLPVTRQSRFLLVTSTVHSRRVLLSFRKQGFTHVRVVSGYRAARPAVASRHHRGSQLPAFVPDSKRYDDPLNRPAWRSRNFFLGPPEVSAVLWYRWKGLV